MTLLDLIQNALDPHQPKRIMLERRNQWKRVLGWAVAVACWLPIIGFWTLFAVDDYVR